MNLDYGTGRKSLKGYKTSDFTGSPAYDFMISNYKINEIEKGEVNKIHCRNVIHHIVPNDVDNVIKEFKRLLRKNGKLIISEPKEEYFKQNKILDIIWYRFLYYDKYIYLPNYYYDFKKDIINNGFIYEYGYTYIKNEVLIYKKN